MESKGKDATELQDKKFLCKLAFLCDILSYLDVLNLQLQGQDRVITDMWAAVRAFKTKLCLWETQMLQENMGHFQCCQNIKEQISTIVFPSAQFAKKLSALSASLPADLPTLNPRNVGLNCSVICLQLTWRAHQPTSKWS